jgi:hypothetical protein
MKSDLKAYSLIFKQEGTAQNERYAAALNPAGVEVDGRKLEDFIVFAQKYTQYIRFVPAEGDVEPVQNWSAFFKDNDVLLMANIATKQIADTKEAYETLQVRFLSEPSEANFIKITALVFSLFKKMDGWYASAAPGTVLNGNLMMYIRSYLAKELHTLGEILDYLPAITKSAPDDLSLSVLSNKSDVWDLGNRESASTSDELFAGKNLEEKLRSAMVTLDKIFNEGYYVMANTINSSKSYFSDALYQQQNHPPHIALFIAFIKLYGHVQQALNTLPQKMLDYYYGDVLGIKMHKAVADEAIVVFELAKGFDTYKLDKGTELSAGKDKNGVDIIYKTNKEVFINKAQVSALKNIFIQKNKSGILSYSPKTIKSDGDYVIEDPSRPFAPWSPFGAPDPAATASIGLGIASGQFYLAKGERRVSLTMELTDAPEFDEIDPSLISLRLTGEKGWINSANTKDYITTSYFKKIGDKQLELNFLIAIAQQSAVVAYDNLLHAGSYKTDKPVLEILLQYPMVPAAPKDDDYNKYISKIKQLNFLQKVSLVGCEVKVQVGTISDKVSFDGVTDLMLQNHESALDSKKPFMPFTSMPKVGSSFYIGCNDLFYKSIQTLTLNVEWMLPDNFHSYYDKYFPPYDSNKFIASLSLLDNQYWKLLDDVKLIDVYASEPKFRSLIINLQKKELDANDTDAKKDVSKFDVARQNGMLKLKLKYPDFGHDVYPQLITASVMEKATSKMATVDFYKIIKKQLHDSVISIKYPDDIADPAGSMKVVVYDILEKIKDKERARGMIINGLDVKLKNINGSEVSFTEIKQFSDAMNSAGHNVVIVNDDNFIERIFRFLRRVKLIDKSIHFDEDKQNVSAVVESINDNIDKHVDFILPADQEMVELIISETNSAISKVVVKIADKLLAANTANGAAITEVFKKEIDSANEIINDLIARKIATLLSAHDVPPKPYTPLINSFAISYVSTRQLNPYEDQFFQVMPFGVKEVFPLGNKENSNDAGAGRNIFPGFLTVDDKDENKPSGLLFIGIRDVLPNQNISLYFQIEEGSRKSDREPAKLNWRYLAGNNWIPLHDEFLRSDDTFELQTSGVIEIIIPPDANNANTVFQENSLFWLCVAVARDIDAFPLVKDVKTQAVAATFFDRENNVLRLSNSLPMQQISKLAEKPPAVKSIIQPEASKNGRAKEHLTQYYTRVSERLRHKGRAVNNWDYERLVLERFPFVYKIKCINNYAAGQMIAGHVTLIPVVKIANPAGNETTGFSIPKASYVKLLEIKKFIAAKTSPFVSLHVINPQIDYVKVNCNVKFIAGAEKGYYLNKLNNDIILFLTPWARDNEQTISFSAKIYMSSIMKFIDSLSYVDFVSNLVMNQYTLLAGGGESYCRAENQTTALVETQFTTAHSILVSAPAHQIQLF